MILTSVLAAHMFLAIPADEHIVKAAVNYSIDCKVDAAPHIDISVTTDDIDYNYSKGALELTKLKTDTKSPYPQGSDTVTGGLRADHPTIHTKMEWDVVYEQKGNMGCMRYKKISVDMHLKPKIFVAREFDKPGCRDAVLGHERRHVQVDREVMNKYASITGKAVQGVVNRVGAIGPFNMRDIELIKLQSSDYITDTMRKIEKAMVAELQERQQKVDSLEEYKRVGSFCKNVQVRK